MPTDPPPAVEEPQKPRFHALNALDEKLTAYIGDRHAGFYVELGANDGIDQSNTCYFERAQGWRGVLIEPVLHNYLKCLENRGARNAVFCAACVPFDYRNEFVKLIYSNLMTISPDLDSDIPDAAKHAETGLRFLHAHERNVVFGALARTLTSILDEAGAPARMDLLSLDVEGGEIDVLKGLDFSRYRFDFMLIENRSIDRLSAYLGTHGYRLIDRLSEQDYLFSPA